MIRWCRATIQLVFVVTGLTPSCLALAHPLDRITYGAEFTFFNLKTQDNHDWAKILDRMKKHLIEDQPEGAKFQVFATLFQSPNGWSYSVGLDPGVVEIRPSPATVETWKHFKTDMQDAIFVSAANEGFFPAMFQGGGHINIGTEVLFENPLLLRNFIVDLYNHNELFLGVLDYNTEAAPSFSILHKRGREEAYQAIELFDRGHYQGKEGMLQFLKSLRFATRGKISAVSFVNVDESHESRIELRAIRPQASMDVWIKQIELIQHRLKYLYEIKNPIPVKWKIPVQEYQPYEPKRHDLNPPVDPQDALKAFYEYVTESGLKWQNYTEMLWPKWVTDGEVTKFENSQWFKKVEAKYSCERDLAA